MFLVMRLSPLLNPLKNFLRTKLADFERVEHDLATFEIGKNTPTSRYFD